MNSHVFAMICNYKGHDGVSLVEMIQKYYESRSLNNPRDLAVEYLNSIYEKFGDKAVRRV